MKATKHETKKLKELASKLPETFYPANVERVVSGLEALKNKNIDKRNFQGVNPSSSYIVKKSEMFPVNHERRIVKAYEAGGMEAVKTYIRGVQELAINSTNKLKGLE